MQTMQIAIDGPAASGKSTVARLVARRLGGTYINTGDMYRTVAWQARTRGIDPENDPDAVARMIKDLDLEYRREENGGPCLFLNGNPVPQKEIRRPEVTACVSAVARIPAVRKWMVERQRRTRRFGLVVMEGRDIGTVIFPGAEHKFFLVATPEERARRRLNQAGEAPADATIQSVAAEIAERDRIDSSREVAPLRPAEDAVAIDSTRLSAEEVADHIVQAVLGDRKGRFR